MSPSRRDFVLRVAKGAAYSAPVIRTLAAPESLRGQGQSENSQKGGMGKGMNMNMDMNNAEVAPGFGIDPNLPTAPWATDPP